MELREVTYLAVALRIAAAVIVGGLIGLERGMKNRAAGMRTYMTVCLGACLVMLTNQYIFQVFGTGDPVRMGAQVVSGIGFLGAGTIVVTRRSQIKGLTTAAGLWASAGVGLALGVGFYEAAFAGGLAVFFVMTLLQGLDNRMHKKTKSFSIYFELNRETPLGDFLRLAQEKNLGIRDLVREGSTDEGNYAYIATVKLTKRSSPIVVCDEIRNFPGVEYLEDL